MPRYGSWPTYSMSDHGAVLAQCIAQIGYVLGARWPFAMHAHGGRHADRLAVGKTLGRDPRRRHRFMLGGQTTSGHQKSLTSHRHKIVVGDIVVVVEQPLSLGFSPECSSIGHADRAVESFRLMADTTSSLVSMPTPLICRV